MASRGWRSENYAEFDVAASGQKNRSFYCGERESGSGNMQTTKIDGLRSGIGDFDGLGIFLTDDHGLEVDCRGDDGDFRGGRFGCGVSRGDRSTAGKNDRENEHASQKYGRRIRKSSGCKFKEIAPREHFITHVGNDIEAGAEPAIWSQDSFGAGRVTCTSEQGRETSDLASIGKELRDEAAADADSFFAELFRPDAFEAYTYGRKNGHMENGQESVRDALSA
jgi:hypothetical protein